MKTLLTVAACLMMSAAANAADVNDDTLALLGVDNMTVVSDADGLEIRGQGGKKGGGKGHGGKGRNGGSTPIIFQKETVKFIDFAYASQREYFSAEAKAVQFSYGKSERITYIGPSKGFGGGYGRP